MSDFFSGISSGIRMPATQINQGGPLPGGPYTSYDGQINATSDLLSGVTNYGGPKGLPMGSDKNYQQVPHRSQQIIPPLYLPHADLHEPSRVKVSHAVDQGDIAFILLSNRIQNLVLASDMPGPRAHAPGCNAFANLPTVNFLLAGLQRLSGNERIRTCNWAQLAEDFDYKPNIHRHKEMHHARDEVLKLLKTKIIPFGICAGSEKQGGLHETGLAPVQAAVNHVTTMTVDGQNRDLVNYWRAVGLCKGGRGGIQAGDQLIFRLDYLPTKNYTLNHYYKGTVTQAFPTKHMCWQLVPDKFEMDAERNEDFTKFQTRHPNVYDYRVDGYFRIGQSFQHRNAHDADVQNYSNDMCFMRGQLLQITFAPVWVQMDADTRERKHITHHVDTHTTHVDYSTRKRKAGAFAWDDDDDDKPTAVRISAPMPTSAPAAPAPTAAPAPAALPPPTSAPPPADSLQSAPVQAPAKQTKFTPIRTTITEEKTTEGEINPYIVDVQEPITEPAPEPPASTKIKVTKRAAVKKE